ncbi:MAG: HD domain-containing protein [Lachnospiraceae bacterium]|nr:HD domain-containing protein [Lachnospiraceae bacterium]MBQ9605739.1 HD domain-containing protein [Lachnospiraceae bacterium]MBR1524608.1 HD domain-containing protein [Lachnospiraceae bacterium]
MQDDIRDIIIKYGRDILCSEEFKATFGQTHHMSTTVGDHTLGVTAEAVKICLRHGLTDDETMRNVVTACLCHDLGIIGRHDKFKNNVQCLIWHPRHSAEKYMEVTGERNERILDSILCHMFPLKMQIPRYKEGWILVLADKIAAAREKMGVPSVTAEDSMEIMRRLQK